MNNASKQKLRVFLAEWASCYAWPTSNNVKWAFGLLYTRGLFRLPALSDPWPQDFRGRLRRIRDISIVMCCVAGFAELIEYLGVVKPIEL